MGGFKNAFSFRPVPVTVLTVVTYVALLVALLYVHLVPPEVAKQKQLRSWGVDLDEAWSDLQVLSAEFRPYNSRRNDEVRQYLVERIRKILADNGVPGYAGTKDGDMESQDTYDGTVDLYDDGGRGASNVTFAGAGKQGMTVYFEGTNIIVYIHGTNEDVAPVLVNAHYDSVSTGYGATDDGIAVVSILQVIKSFTRPASVGKKPITRGLVALLNNGEEDYLNGARAFAMHPISKLPRAFLNLEGAGAGGRATLFRSTDAEVTAFYAKSSRPFGSVLSDDGFKKGLIRSQTDYKIFTEDLGMRGLDVAFWQPRSQYHTDQDDARHTSKRSLWHMLGTSLETLKAMTDDYSNTFESSEGKPGEGHRAVWFDVFGRSFGLMRLHTLFAIAVTLLVVPPLVMIVSFYGLSHVGKLYYFNNTPLRPEHSKTTRGLRGMVRFPVAFIIASAAVVGLAYLVTKINPMIVYSSQYSVWVMFLAAWWSVSWVILRGADKTRPTALYRSYALIGQMFIWFLVLAAVTALIRRSSLASGYWVILPYAGIFLSAWISVLEVFAVEKRPDIYRPSDSQSYGSEGHSQIAASEQEGEPNGPEETDEDPTEETPLFRGPNHPRTFAYSRNPNDADGDADGESDELVREEGVYGKEQPWSKDLPSGLWILQFLFSVPVPLIFATSIALFGSTALAQTGADGNSMLTVYLFMGIMSIILLLPVSPFLHRVKYQVTTFIILAFIGTLIYNLVAFPFSPSARLKVYFQQTVDLETGLNQVHLVGHPDYIEGIVKNYIPSAREKATKVTTEDSKDGLVRVSWDGLAPNVAATVPDGVPPDMGMSDWVSYKVKSLGPRKARISVKGKNTRSCRVLFKKPVFDIEVLNGQGENSSGNSSLTDAKHPKTRRHAPTLGDPVPKGGSKEIRLWSREWDTRWDVVFTWDKEGNATSIVETLPSLSGEIEEHTELRTVKKDDTDGIDGQVVCLWDDASRAKDEIPALHEVDRFLPNWATVSKLSDGLVHGSRPFMI